MEKDFSRQFTKCPACGSEERFLEELGKELIERGIARKGWAQHMDVKHGVVVDTQTEANIPIGSVLPTFNFMTDICMDCGCVYAVNITRGEVTKSVMPQQPNRADRRRLERNN